MKERKRDGERESEKEDEKCERGGGGRTVNVENVMNWRCREHERER